MEENGKTIVAPIGGQAVMEGVMMRGTTAMALAVRDPEGDIRLETYRLKGRKWYNKMPIVRGVASFVISLVSGMKMLARSADISAPEEESVGKGGMAFALILGMLLAVGLFIVIPEFLAGLVRDYLLKDFDTGVRVLLHSLAGGLLRILIFILYLVFCSKMKDIKRTFMYHGAEHKTINCYEKGEALTIENIQKCSTVHRRCGTTFLFLVMIVSILLFAFANWIFEIAGLTMDSKMARNLVRMAIKLALLPIVAGLAYEVLRFFAKLPYNLFTKILMAPGLALQKLTTVQPDDGMVEVALRSFNAALEMEHNPNIPEIKYPDHRFSDVFNYIVSRLKAIGAEEVEAYWILCHITGLSRNSLHEVKIISDADYKKVKEMLSRRENKEPLDYILGYSIFYGQMIEVNSDVLIPRMETEILCEAAIKEIGESNCSVLDLCTGSGCIALTIVNKTKAVVTASDISSEALMVASRNLNDKNCTIILSDLFSDIKGKFDIIVSNPPYIRTAELKELQSEVTCQPRLALDGGTDGLYYYRQIIAFVPGRLNRNGVLLLEIGHDQAEEVIALLSERFRNITVIKDLSGSDRVIRAELKSWLATLEDNNLNH